MKCKMLVPAIVLSVFALATGSAFAYGNGGPLIEDGLLYCMGFDNTADLWEQTVEGNTVTLSGYAGNLSKTTGPYRFGDAGHSAAAYGYMTQYDMGIDHTGGARPQEALTLAGWVKFETLPYGSASSTKYATIFSAMGRQPSGAKGTHLTWQFEYRSNTGQNTLRIALNGASSYETSGVDSTNDDNAIIDYRYGGYGYEDAAAYDCYDGTGSVQLSTFTPYHSGFNETNRWYHIATTYDKAGNDGDGEVCIYVDGLLMETLNPTALRNERHFAGVTGNTAWGSKDLSQDWARSTRMFEFAEGGRRLNDGDLDEFYLFDRALSASEVRALTIQPEPATLAMLFSGLLGLAAYTWRKRNRK